jgi:thioredoxin 2
MEIACPHCSQRNRVPDERIAQGPSCGKCHQLLLDAPITAGAPGFAALVGQQQVPVLVDFWAPWCAPCLNFAPTFKAAAGKFTGQAIFAKVDTEEEQALGQQFAIRSIPTLIAFFRGREIGRVSGALPAGELDRLVQQVIERAAAGGAPA